MGAPNDHKATTESDVFPCCEHERPHHALWCEGHPPAPAPNATEKAQPAHPEDIHACPPKNGGGLMPCCGRTPFEVSPWDRMTLEPMNVTCGEGTRWSGAGEHQGHTVTATDAWEDRVDDGVYTLGRVRCSCGAEWNVGGWPVEKFDALTIPPE